MRQLRPLLRLKPYLKPVAGLILASALLAVPLAGLRTAPALLIKHVLDEVILHRDATRLRLLPWMVIGLYAANFVVRFLHFYLMRIVVARLNQRIKNDLYEHLIGLSADHFSSQTNGVLISRVAADPEYIVTGLNSITALIREPVTFLCLFGYALSLNWRLTTLTVLIFPPLAWVFSRTGRNLKRYITRMTEENSRIFASLQESFSGIRMIESFRLEKYVRGIFRERNAEYTRQLLKTAVLEEASHPTVELLTAFLIAGVIYYGGMEVLGGRMTQGELLAFFASFALMMNPLRTFNDVNIKLNQSAAACARVFEVFDWKTSIPEAASAIRLSTFERELEFDGVTFAYPDEPGRPVLRDMSFRLNKGRVIALVGPSGGGKSSLVNLIPRIFDVTGGAIRIDGHDIRELSLDSLRKLLAIVSQDVFLFNDTIEENIRCGRLNATREEIREAARQAHAMGFIEALPQGFQTVIGDRGQKLSGGQRQRLSIARAFLRQAPILILDEATSSLDTRSEKAVQAALDELMVNRTTLVVAHRLSTVRHADEILVVKDGEIVERGEHRELLARGGEYLKLYGSAPA